jgi:hypothetical protein
MFPVALANSETWFLKKAERQTTAAKELLGNHTTWESLWGHRKSHGKSIWQIIREKEWLEKQLLEGVKKKGRPKNSFWLYVMATPKCYMLSVNISLNTLLSETIIHRKLIFGRNVPWVGLFKICSNVSEIPNIF